MLDFLALLKSRNEYLFYFGMLCLFLAVLILILSKIVYIQMNGVNTWYKPAKFALSIGIFSLTMGWYTGYLDAFKYISVYNWSVIIFLGFELFYITLQASRSQLSHYNFSSGLYTSLTVAMAIAAIAVTLYTGYIGILFCTYRFATLPDYYVWAIRLGIFLFVIFASEGAVMGANGSPRIGANDGQTIPFLNWSLKYGDLRIAHFIGMHALQLLPLLAVYLLKDLKMVFLTGFLYAILAFFCLVLALNGKSWPNARSFTKVGKFH
ncbi:membrane protein [Pedobacter sp. BMA]|nr:membrane protein [Pedobacter sp. BMA]